MVYMQGRCKKGVSMKLELTEKQANEFLKAIDNPPEANKALKVLIKEIYENRTKMKIIEEKYGLDFGTDNDKELGKFLIDKGYKSLSSLLRIKPNKDS